MPEKFWRKKALTLKAETVYGTDAVPTGVANAMLARNVTLRPLQGGRVTRNLDKPYLGGQGSILVGTHVGLDFEIEVAGAGAAVDPPKYGPAHRACGLAETITPVTGPVAYDPVSAAFESASIYLNVDAVLHKLLGSRGNLGMAIRANELAVWRYAMLGFFVAPSDTALPTIDTTGFQDPLPVSKANTPTFTLNGYAGALRGIELDLGNQVTFRALANKETVVIGDRNVTGRVTVEADTLATFNPFALATARTRVPLQVIHGTVAGNIVQVDLPTIELGEPTYENVDGIVEWTIPFEAVPSDAGNDEVKITTK